MALNGFTQTSNFISHQRCNGQCSVQREKAPAIRAVQSLLITRIVEITVGLFTYRVSSIHCFLTALPNLSSSEDTANLLCNVKLVWFWFCMVRHTCKVSPVLLIQDLSLRVYTFNLLSGSFGGNVLCIQDEHQMTCCSTCCPAAGWGMCLEHSFTASPVFCLPCWAGEHAHDVQETTPA